MLTIVDLIDKKDIIKEVNDIFGKDNNKIYNILYTVIISVCNDLWERYQFVNAVRGSKLFTFDITFKSASKIWQQFNLINCGYMTTMVDHQSMIFGGLIDKASEDHFNYVPIISLRIIFFLKYDANAIINPTKFKNIFILIDNSRINKNLNKKILYFTKKYIQLKKLMNDPVINYWSKEEINIDDFKIRLLQCWLHLCIRARNGGLFKLSLHEDISFARFDIIQIYQRVSEYHIKSTKIKKIESNKLATKYPKLNNNQTNPFNLYQKYPSFFMNKQFNQQLRQFISTLYKIIGSKDLNCIIEMNLHKQLYNFHIYIKFCCTILSLIDPIYWDALLSLWIFDITLEQWLNDDINIVNDNLSLPSYIAPPSSIIYLFYALELNDYGIYWNKYGYINMKHLQDTITSCYKWRQKKQRFGTNYMFKKYSGLWDPLNPKNKNVESTFKNAIHYDTLYPLWLCGFIGVIFATGAMAIEHYHMCCNGWRVKYESLLTWIVNDIINKLVYNSKHFYYNILKKKVWSTEYSRIIHDIFEQFHGLTGLLSLIKSNYGWYTLKCNKILTKFKNIINDDAKFHTSESYRQQWNEIQLSKNIKQYSQSESFNGKFTQKDINKIANTINQQKLKNINIVRRICQMNLIIDNNVLDKYIKKQNYLDEYKDNHDFNWELTNISIDVPDDRLENLYITRNKFTLYRLKQQLEKLIFNNELNYSEKDPPYNFQHQTTRIDPDDKINQEYLKYVKNKRIKTKLHAKNMATYNSNVLPYNYSTFSDELVEYGVNNAEMVVEFVELNKN